MATNCAKHYKCVDPADFKPLSNVIALGILTGALVIAQIVVAIFAGAAIPGLGIVTGVLFVAAIFAICAFLEGGKSVCLEKPVCVIGRIMELIEVDADKSGFEKIDDDFTFNLLPSPHSPRETLDEMVASDPFQAKFMVEQTATLDLGLPFAGEDVDFTDLAPHLTEVLHCEVKGCRVHDVCIVLKIMSFPGAAVAVVCSIPIIGWLVCLILAAIWVAITVAVVAIAWAAAHNGDINDVYDPAAGKLTAANEDTGEGGDVILVKGDWDFDAAHGGWNEIHPVRHVQKVPVPERFRSMAKASPALVLEFETKILAPWCFFVEQADDPKVRDAQDDPENGWHVHPLVDGCEEEVIIK